MSSSIIRKSGSLCSRIWRSSATPGGLILSNPWSATQLRPKFCGSDVRPGNVIERKGKVYQVVKMMHRTPGKGGALIQVELRDVDSGNKVNERLRTDEAVERVYVEQKRYTYLYTDEETDSVVLMEPKTYDQVEVPKALFGGALAYLKDDMSVTVELYDDKPMSASVPPRVTCTVVETQAPVKGIGATPHTKKALLDNGLTIQVPAHILTGDQLLIDTTDNSYMSRA
ncbi:uncharacterized protein LOC141668573 [Apium graveolens]|uniref:uncharacterized protein LOC141668573 n=1 Tax=Apium graveolens TaxID=4045 RepID=UPI003D79AD33